MKHLLLTTIAVTSLLATTAFADPIHDAVNRGDLAGVQAELDKGANVNAKLDSGWTPLHYAVYKGHKEITELLVTAGAEVNAKDGEGLTPLHQAARYNRLESAEWLIANGADVHAKTKRLAWTPLHYAARSQEFGVDMVELLITSGADLNAKGNIDVNSKDRLGATPLDHALGVKIRFRSDDTIDLLRKYGGRTGPEDIAYQFESLNKTLTLLQHLIIRDDAGVDPDKPSIEKLQGVFVIQGKVGGNYEVQYHTGDNEWQLRETVTLQANRQLYIDSSSYDEKRFYRVKLVE